MVKALCVRLLFSDALFRDILKVASHREQIAFVIPLQWWPSTRRSPSIDAGIARSISGTV